MAIASITKRGVVALMLLPLVSHPAIADEAAMIVVDGNIGDWASVPAIATDPAGDVSGGVDLVSLRATHDSHTLYLLLEAASPFSPVTADLVLYVDGDGLEDTGFPYGGAGMDFSWSFRENAGTSYVADRSEMGRGQLVTLQAPYAVSKHLELALDLSLLPAAHEAGTVSLAFYGRDSRDRLPVIGDAVRYKVDGPVFRDRATDKLRKNPGDLRVLSWNVLKDNPLDPVHEPRFGRVIRALKPDIVLFQELYQASPSWVRGFMDEWHPLPEGEFWQVVRKHDCITVSRFSIRDFWSSDGNILTVIDTYEALGRDLFVVNAHLPCCDNVSGRMQEARSILTSIAVAREQGRFASQSAILIGGDLNTGGHAEELVSLVNGTHPLLADAVTLDADGSPLADASPLHVGERSTHTWRSIGSRDFGSRLDYVLYSDSNLLMTRGFVLETRNLEPDSLDAYRLHESDTEASDHLPLVVDFRNPYVSEVWGTQRITHNGYLNTDWFGSVYATDYPFVYHPLHTWLVAYESYNGFYFYDFLSGSWWWSSSTYYPNAYSYDMQSWIYWAGYGGDRWYYSYDSKNWSNSVID